MHRDLTGETYGRRTVISGPLPGGKNSYWLCECECGNLNYVATSNLKRGQCNQCKECQVTNHPNNRPLGEAAFTVIWCEYKKSAISRKLPLELTKEQFRNLITKNCNYCKRAPFKTRNKSIGRGGFTFNGIDRVDNSIGYTLKNSVPCCYVCNRAKSTMTQDEFKDWVQLIYRNFGSK